MLLLWVAGSYLVIACSERKFYDSLPSLQLRGAGRIHLYPAQARDYRRLVQNLNDHCDIFMRFPEFPSLHIWTGKDPLAGLEFDDWMLVASNKQQIAASAVLSQHANDCAIYNPDLVAFWNRAHQNWDSLPLVRYLHENLKVVGVTGPFYFLVGMNAISTSPRPFSKSPSIHLKSMRHGNRMGVWESAAVIERVFLYASITPYLPSLIATRAVRACDQAADIGWCILWKFNTIEGALGTLWLRQRSHRIDGKVESRW